MNRQESPSAKIRILTIQKSLKRTVQHLKMLGRTGGLAIFSAVFYLLYWKNSSIREQYENIFWWIALAYGAFTVWKSETAQPQTTTLQKSPNRTLQHLRALGKIAGTVIASAVFELLFLKNNSFAGQYESLFRWFTIIAAAFAIWGLIRDWLMTSNMTFVFDGDRGTFCVQEKGRILAELPLRAIKRIKIAESSNVFPVYVLSVHLRDAQIIEIDANAKRAEIDLLADQIAELTGAEIVFQAYNEPLSKEEKEEQVQRQRNEVWKGD